jgi:hypothetical protein
MLMNEPDRNANQQDRKGFRATDKSGRITCGGASARGRENDQRVGTASDFRSA